MGGEFIRGEGVEIVGGLVKSELEGDDVVSKFVGGEGKVMRSEGEELGK